MGTYRTETWFKPREVVRKIGEGTSRLKVGSAQFRERHQSKLHARAPHIRGKHGLPNYTAHETNSAADYAEHVSYSVKKILAQRQNAFAPSAVEFKVR